MVLSSMTRALSCPPPPLVRRMNGILLRERNANAWEAPGIGIPDLRRTPSMLEKLVWGPLQYECLPGYYSLKRKGESR